LAFRAVPSIQGKVMEKSAKQNKDVALMNQPY
jgi:hypothetical protein